MIVAEFAAKCPFEIGDIVRVGQSMGTTERPNIKIITDIACVHYVRSGRVEFRYEFDESGIYAPIEIESGRARE